VLGPSARRLRHELLSSACGAESLLRLRPATRGAGPSRGPLEQLAAELGYWVHRSGVSGVVVKVSLGGLTELGELEIVGARGFCLPGGAAWGRGYWNSGCQDSGLQETL